MFHPLRIAFRINLFSLILLLLFYGLLLENHTVLPLNGSGEVQIGGPSFIEASTYEQFALRDGQLVAPTAPAGSTPAWALFAQPKDCRT